MATAEKNKLFEDIFIQKEKKFWWDSSSMESENVGDKILIPRCAITRKRVEKRDEKKVEGRQNGNCYIA